MSSSSSTPSPLHRAAQEIKRRVDCADLADRLGLDRPGGKGSFKNPSDPQHSAALACYQKGGVYQWQDHRNDVGGDAIDLLLLVRGGEWPEAVRELCRMYSIPIDEPQRGAQPRRELSKEEWIAERCLQNGRQEPHRGKLLSYLLGRGLSERAVMHAINRHTLGFNDWSSPTVPAGEVSHGGDAAAFVVRHHETEAVVAVDMRYLDAATNGGVKTQTQGDKASFPWCSDWRRFRSAKTVYLCESAINALSVDTCELGHVAAVATRGTAVGSIDWRMFIGKRVVLAFDNDKPLEPPNKRAGLRPGLVAAWEAHAALLALDVPALLVDYSDWVDDEEAPINDLNDYLQEHGTDKLKQALRQLEPWLIPGLPGKETPGKPRLYLPFHDVQTYWRYRVKDDFTSWVSKFQDDEETGKQKLTFENVCGFRVAGISRITIASPTATMTGDQDMAPTEAYALSVQVPRKPDRLLRRVVSDEQLHNVEQWKKLGPVFSAPSFGRLLNILERSADIGARKAVNFVGLAWRDGVPIVNEGPDCYFTDAAQQCPYSALTFPSGPRSDAAEVVGLWQATFKGNGAMLMLLWSLGAHLKAYLGFWPHFILQAEKGVGKTTLEKRLERAVGMTIFSGQTLQTEFRILTSISHTSHPVGWEEISARKQELINKAVTALQECYQYAHTRRGAQLLDFLLCAPVLLVGEDVPVKSITGKTVRNRLVKADRGTLIPEDAPRFPVREWLHYLAATPKARVQELHRECVDAMAAQCRADRDGAGADRMLSNWGAMRAAWMLLADFAGIAVEQGDMLRDLTAEMNAHIKESVSDRQPWVWIVETLLSEIARGSFRYPYVFDETEEGEAFLGVRTSHVMDHIAREHTLREFWDSLPVKSDRVFKAALRQADVLALDDVERTVDQKIDGKNMKRRVAHMVGMSLPALEKYGLYAVRPEREAAPAFGAGEPGRDD
jgi:hypothetical protein